MVGLKSYSRIHQHPISQIPSTNLIRKPRRIHKPFLQFQPIQTHSFSNLRFKRRRVTTREVKALFSEDKEESNGGWDGREIGRIDLKQLLDPERDNVLAVGLTGALAWAGARLLWQLFMATMAVLITGIKYTFVGVVLIVIVITFLDF